MKIQIEVEYSTYDKSVDKKGGKQFISVNYSRGNGGGCSPCDSREEALESMKGAVTIDCYGDSIQVSEKDVELIDNTDLNFTKGEILGQDLKRWF